MTLFSSCAVLHFDQAVGSIVLEIWQRSFHLVMKNLQGSVKEKNPGTALHDYSIVVVFISLSDTTFKCLQFSRAVTSSCLFGFR